MIAFVPVARYRVEYQVASGRPFSPFERLLLSAINDGNATLDALADLFRLHRRMVIEGVVTLMQAGWVCLSADGFNFITTPSGKRASDSSELPATIVITNKTTTLLLEKVAGQFARGADVDLYTKQRLDKLWAAGVSIPPGDVPNTIEPGMITHLLPHDPGEWIRLVGPVSVVADNRFYAIVDVDIPTGKLAGVPHAWHSLLVGELVDRVQHAVQNYPALAGSDDENQLRNIVAEAEGSESQVQSTQQRISLQADDFLTTPEQHIAVLRDVLQTARSFVTIVSTTLSEAALETDLPLLQSALSRDLLVCVFWGIRGEDHSAHLRALNVLKKLEYDSSHGKYQGRLITNSVALGTAINALIADSGDGGVVAFGTFRWLCSRGDGRERHLSVKIPASPIASRFCDFIADLASKDGRIQSSSAITSLRKAAAGMRAADILSGRADNSGFDAESDLLFDEAAHWWTREVIDLATESVTLLAGAVESARISQVLKQMAAAAQHVTGSVVVVHGNTDPNPAAAPMGEPGIILRNVPAIAATALWIDGDTLLLGNHPLLCDAGYRCRPYGGTVVLALRANNIGDLVAGRLGLSSIDETVLP